MTELIRNSGTNWTIVRFTAPNDIPKTVKLRVGFYGSDKIGFPVTRGDIAAFTAAQVDDRTYIGRAPAISN
ncbi:NAD(P)H-binding protein [Agromyces albus]|nr:NAD(P)H-binding protein [Agromyces albus]